MPAGSIGKITLDKKSYNIALEPGSYKVSEVPNHGDIDPKMERRVIWRNFSLGLERKREDASMDSTSMKSNSFTYMRQVRNPEGFYWAAGCDTTRQDRVFAQRATTASNFSSSTEKINHFVDGSLASVAMTQKAVWVLTPPGTWTVSATLSPAGLLNDIIQYGGQIYVCIIPSSGIATSVGATTLTDTTASYLTNQFVGSLLISGNSTATVTSNTGTVITFSGGWTGGTPALQRYQLNTGIYTWNQLSSGSWVQQPPTVSASHFTVIREQLWRSLNANIYSTINTDPAGQIWSGATIIGDPNSPITNLDTFKDFLMIFKQDGVYSADKTGNVYPIFPGFKTLGTNPRPIGQFQDTYYFASDVGLVWAYSPRGGVKRVGFDFAEPYPMNPADATRKYGVPNVAVVEGIPLTHYMIVGFNQYQANSTSSAFFFGWDGTGWHPIKYFPNASVNAVGLTGGNLSPASPMLHFAITPNGGNSQVHYMLNPLVDPFIAGSFDTAVQTMYFPADQGALEDEYKVLERVNVYVDNAIAGKIKMYYAIDDEIASLTFHDMGDPQFQGAQGNQVFNPPFPLPAYIKCMLKMTITATASTASPEVRNVILHYKQRSPQRRMWEVVILADQNLVTVNGRVDSRTAKKIIADLNKARINHKQVTLVDALSNESFVYVDEVAEEIRILKGKQAPSYAVTVRLVENVDGH